MAGLHGNVKPKRNRPFCASAIGRSDPHPLSLLGLSIRCFRQPLHNSPSSQISQGSSAGGRGSVPPPTQAPLRASSGAGPSPRQGARGPCIAARPGLLLRGREVVWAAGGSIIPQRKASESGERGAQAALGNLRRERGGRAPLVQLGGGRAGCRARLSGWRACQAAGGQRSFCAPEAPPVPLGSPPLPALSHGSD